MNKLLICIPLLFLFSCTKDKVPLIIDDGGLISPEGNYYCISTYEQQYSAENTDISYDLVINIDIVNDTITVDGFNFPIAAYDIPSGSGSCTVNPSSSTFATLSFSSGFEQIDFYSYYYAGAGSPTIITTYSGSKTGLALTDGSNMVYFNAMEGPYQMYVEEREDFNGLDTTYNGQLSVDYLPSVSTPGIAINGNNRTFNYFHSYYNSHSLISNSGYSATYDRNYYWANDSLYYDYLQRNWDNTLPDVDTIHYHYEGSKL